MAKISRQIDEIEKLIQKQQQTPKEKLKIIEEELNKIKTSQKGFTNLHYQGEKQQKENERIKTLEQAKSYLLDQIEQEEEKKELNKIKLQEKQEKQLKKEIEALLFYNINQYFLKYPEKEHRKIWQLLHDKEVIKDEINGIIKSYGSEFTDYCYSIYIKTITKVYKLYEYNIKEQEKDQKAEIKSINAKLKRSIAKDIAVIGIIKASSRKKRRY